MLLDIRHNLEFPTSPGSYSDLCGRPCRYLDEPSYKRSLGIHAGNAHKEPSHMMHIEPAGVSAKQCLVIWWAMRLAVWLAVRLAQHGKLTDTCHSCQFRF